MRSYRDRNYADLEACFDSNLHSQQERALECYACPPPFLPVQVAVGQYFLILLLFQIKFEIFIDQYFLFLLLFKINFEIFVWTHSPSFFDSPVESPVLLCMFASSYNLQFHDLLCHRICTSFFPWRALGVAYDSVPALGFELSALASPALSQQTMNL